MERIMKFPKRYYLTLLWTWQVDLILWFLTATVFRPLFGANLHWEGLVLQCERKSGKHFLKIRSLIISGMSLGHVALYSKGKTKDKGLDTKIELHEHGHTEQWEGNMLFSTLISALITVFALVAGVFYQFLYLILFVWLFGGYAIYFARGLQAGVRGEDLYKGNTDEESMRSQHNRK